MRCGLIRPVGTVVLALFLMLAAAAAGEAAQGESRLDAIAKAGEVRVGVAEFAPFVYKNPKTNALEGLEIDMAELLAKELGVKLTLVEGTWPTLFAGLQAGKYDIVMSGSKRTLRRALTVAFTDPYVSLTEYVMVRKRDNLKTWADVDRKGAVVTTLLGGAPHLSLQNHPDAIKNAKLMLFKDLTLCGNAVVAGQATGWIEDVVSISMFMKQHPDVELDMLPVPYASHGEGNGYAIAPGDPHFLNWLNIFIAKHQNYGTYAKLAEKYGLPSSILVKGFAQR